MSTICKLPPVIRQKTPAGLWRASSESKDFWAGTKVRQADCNVSEKEYEQWLYEDSPMSYLICARGASWMSNGKYRVLISQKLRCRCWRYWEYWEYGRLVLSIGIPALVAPCKAGNRRSATY